uniref:Uncharacterized protein n=1 Tax=Vespula pensylvanica TaxID=30213 RepID=A0A834PBF0_VESPE|nr:hypothetical protein H0235_003074 [Vespula pensylvanica]
MREYGYPRPVNIRARIILQRLYLSRISWDQSMPFRKLIAFWKTYRNHLRLKRIVHTKMVLTNYIFLQFFGFCDTSERNYECVSLLRIALIK